jgi:hypothetical protein
MRWAVPLPFLLVLAAVTGCGGDPAAQRPEAPSSATERPALLRAPHQSGEVVVAGETSPKTAGPFAFHGRYRVAFEQYAPEAPDTDFGAQTAFVVDLERLQGIPSIHLFQVARRSGRRTISLDARLYVDVSFGDFPFVVRFTPMRR